MAGFLLLARWHQVSTFKGQEKDNMTPESVLTIGHDALMVAVLLILVMLIPALIVGLLVSMFQAATQINEMTLSFIPKLLITLGMVFAAGPWMLNLIVGYMQKLLTDIPYLIG